jgi:hypothetical protein
MLRTPRQLARLTQVGHARLRRLELRADEPRIEASERAAQQLRQNAARTPLLRVARLAAVALAVVAAGVLVASNGNLRQTVR